MRAGEPLKLPPMKTFFALVTQSSSFPLVTQPFSNLVRWNSWRKIRMEYIRIMLDNGEKDSGAPSTLCRGNFKKNATIIGHFVIVIEKNSGREVD